MAQYYLSGYYQNGERYSHRYVFYFFPKVDDSGKELDKGFFRFFGKVQHGKEVAERTGRKYVHERIF